MIYYNRGRRFQLKNMLRMRGSVFPASCAVALPCAAISFLLKWYGLFDNLALLNNATAWSGFSSLVGFLVVFRTSEAYSRFWEGCKTTHRMRAEWLDACSALMAFTRASKAEREKVDRFQHLIVRLFSLLHAMALGEIEDCSDLDSLDAFNLELIDPSGMDRESWMNLGQCTDKVTLVFSWIQGIIVDNIATGVLAIPPPVLSRVFQELSGGMVALHDAQRIAQVPFPFPYAQSCDSLLAFHWLITPLVTVQWVATPWAAAIFGFLQVFILWALNNIAVEIEHPFGKDANDLDSTRMQVEMNMRLLLLLHPVAQRTPELSEDAEISSLVAQGRKTSIRLRAGTHSYNDIMSSVDCIRQSASREVAAATGSSAAATGSSASGEEQQHGDGAAEHAAEASMGSETGSAWARRYSADSFWEAAVAAPLEDQSCRVEVEQWPPKPQSTLGARPGKEAAPLHLAVCTTAASPRGGRASSSCSAASSRSKAGLPRSAAAGAEGAASLDARCIHEMQAPVGRRGGTLLCG